MPLIVRVPPVILSRGSESNSSVSPLNQEKVGAGFPLAEQRSVTDWPESTVTVDGTIVGTPVYKKKQKNNRMINLEQLMLNVLSAT